MLQELRTWPEKLQEGYELAGQLYAEHAGALPKNIKKIAFFGMGGSGAAGKIIKTILEKKVSLPIYVIDFPELLPAIDTDTLAIVVSYSGNTWETVAALEQLVERHIPTVVVSRGGNALQIAQSGNVPFVIVPQTSAPRAALGYFLGFLLGLFETTGIFPGAGSVLRDFMSQAEQCVTKFENKTFFNDFLGAVQELPFFHIWGTSGDTDSCAQRAQTQFNENSKLPVVTSLLPEADHNLIVGFGPKYTQAMVVLMYTDFALPKVVRSIEATGEVLAEHGCGLYKVPVFGDTWEKQLISLVLWADFASLYLGQARGVGIVETPQIDSLKEKIRRKGLRK